MFWGQREHPTFLILCRNIHYGHTMGIFSCAGEHMILKWPSSGLEMAPALPVLHIPE